MWNLKSLLCLFSPAYLLSIYFALSGQHLLVLWAGIELNLLAFVGLTKMGAQGRLETNTMKYFLAQAMGSVLLLFGFIALATGLSGQATTLMTISLLLKLGVFPFHAWFMSFVGGSNSIELWTVSVPQKLIPLWALMKFSPLGSLMWASIIIGSYVSTTGALTNSRITLLLGYSSMFNAGWMMAALSNLDTLAVIMMCYGVSLGTFLMLMSTSMTSMSQELKSQPASWTSSALMTLGLLNLGGMPPFFNFWGKAALLESVTNASYLASLIFLMSSVSFMYIYVSLLFTQATFMGSKHTSWKVVTGGNLPGGLIIGLSMGAFIF